MEDEEEIIDDQMHGFGSGSDDLVNLIWNSRDLRQQQPLVGTNLLNESLKRQSFYKNHHSKSVESKGINNKSYKKQQIKKQLINNQNKLQYQYKLQEQQQQQQQPYYGNINNKNTQQQQKNIKVKGGGTKSSREIRSSIGFNDLLNQLDKDVSMNQLNVLNTNNNNNQYDIKNHKNTQEILKLEISGIKRQLSQEGVSGGKQKNKKNITKNLKIKQQIHQQSKPLQDNKPSRSKSKDRKEINKQYGLQNFNQNSQDLEKLISLIKHQTSSNIQLDNLFSQNLRTKSSSSLGGSGHTHLKALTSHLNLTSSKQNLQQQQQVAPGIINTQNKIMKDQSSPDRQYINSNNNIISKEFKPIGNIDKLIRENLKKNKIKEEIEKSLKQKNQETIKKKKNELEYKNNIVRINNKQKTYKKQQEQNNLMQQQSQDPIGQSQGECISLNIKRNNNTRKENVKESIHIFPKFNIDFQHKQSQSQKIDFDKIKSSSKERKLNFKDHRKSYGLEFIDIKKEIEEELRTLDLKIKNNNSSIIRKRNMLQTANNTDQSIKQIKMQSSQKYDMLERKNTNYDDIVTTAPVKKVIVIKKNKIRKFMKNKKKELILQQWQQQNEEIVKTLKVQENLIKLNQFCKKNLGKTQSISGGKHIKKRNIINSGFQHQQQQQLQHINSHQFNQLQDQDKKDMSKITIKFKDSKKKSSHYTRKAQDTYDIGDSSKLSTEFYEEYFRLLNSIKKEQQESSSKIILSDMDLSGSNFTQNYRQLIRSPQNLNNLQNNNKSHSPSSFQNQQIQNKLLSPQNIIQKGRKQKRSKSKGQQKQFAQKRLNIKQNNVVRKSSKENSQIQQLQPKNSRAESAPLIHYQNSVQKKSELLKQKSPKKHQNHQYLLQSNEIRKSQKLFDIIQKAIKIQRFFRNHLNRQGFYKRLYQDDSSNNNYQTQIYEGEVSKKVVETIDKLQSIEDIDQEGDQDEQESDFYDEDDQQLIIINQQILDDDKKVIYMSNINSCSLPQTPKEGDQKKQSSTQSHDIIMNKVFDYKESKPSNNNNNNLQLPSISTKQQLQQQQLDDPSSSSQYSSLQQQELHLNQQLNKIKNDELYKLKLGEQQLKKQQQQKLIEDEKEQKNEDESKNQEYEMRIFTGSESLLREFRLHTPKASNFLINIQDSNQKSASVNALSSQNSQNSIKNNNNQFSVQSQKSVINTNEKNENTSQSSQSLFERNSFQQFTITKLNQIVQNNEFLNLINMREKALEYRQKKEKKFIRKMFKNNQISPRTYKSKQEQLEKWVNIESEEIQKTKKAFEEEWQKTIKMIEDTQKNVDQMREKMKSSINPTTHYQGLFNSSSSKTSNSNQSNIGSINQQSIKNQKSILLDDPTATQLQQKANNDQQSANNTQNNQNLLEYLEDKWVNKTQNNNILNNNSNIINNNNNIYNQRISRQGIYIEDQNDIIQSSQISDSNNNNNNIEEFKQQIDVIFDPQIQEEERPLQRSRSEQDLTDILQKSKVELQHFKDEDQQSQGQQLFDSDEDDQQLLTNRQLFNNFSQINLKEQINHNNNQIQIQENNYTDEINNKKKQQQYSDFESNDSLLNESDLNNYFQDQRFSIEDFKSLDKKKLMEQQEEDEIKQEEEETARLMKRQDDDIVQQQEEQVDQEQNIINKNQDLLLKHIQQTVIDDNSMKQTDNNSNNFEEPQQPIFLQNIEYQKYRMHTPDIESQNNFSIQQQQLLFSNAKPGENIKISDILKKNQSFNGGLDSQNSFILDSSNTSQHLLFQNHQINQSIQQSHNPIASIQDPINNNLNNSPSIIDQITDEVLKLLLQQSIVIPQRPIEKQPQQQQAQIDNQDYFMIDSQQNEKEQRREFIELRQRQLVEADLQKVEIYINEIISALLQSELNALTSLQGPSGSTDSLATDYHKQFLSLLTNPIKKSELDFLNLLQTSEIGSYAHFETTQDSTLFPILPVDLYLEIERQREEQQLKLYSNLVTVVAVPNQNLNLENSLVQESIHIHNKAVFDALNESLMKFRPYGLQGEPMPWSNKNRRLQTRVDANSVDTERLFQMVKQDVLRWVSTYSGCQPSPVYIFRKSSNFNNNNSQNAVVPQAIKNLMIGEIETFDEELFQETRERRLAQMLAAEVIETEHLWLNYEFEEAQVKIDLSDMILEHMVEEIVMFLEDKNNNKNKQV